MDKQKLKEALLVGIEGFLNHEKEIGNKTTQHEFDCFLGGLMSGLTFPEHVMEEVHANVKEISKFIYSSKVVRDAGIKMSGHDDISVDVKIK